MYAFIKHSGKQFKVIEGCTISLDQIQVEPGISFDVTDIPIIVRGESEVLINPQATVVLEVISHYRSKKMLVLKQRPKKGYRRTKSQRHLYTKVLVKQISLSA